MPFGHRLSVFTVNLQLQAPVYFCDPHSKWQRGSNETTKRLL